MKLQDIEDDPVGALALLERYVNDGSPSGFTFVNTTSERTRPRSMTPAFPLTITTAATDVTIHDLGHIPDGLLASEWDHAERSILIHPDMVGHVVLNQFRGEPDRLSLFEVTPTSSARTVRIESSQLAGYVKLHYEGHLGRILRRITLKHALAARETDGLLERMVREGRLPASFAFLRESGARIYEASNEDTSAYWGMIWRPAQPVGPLSSSIRYLIPAFSLFSADSRDPNSPSILQQLGDIHSDRKKSFLLDELVLPTIRSYFAMLMESGLQGEWHSQNVLFGFDSSWRCVANVLRDLESIDRDLPLMMRSGQSTELESYPYKCFDYSDVNYTVRHSFMFDHKFGEYLLAPLIDHACAIWQLDPRHLESAAVDLVMALLRGLPRDFLPADGSWYKFENRLIDQSVSQRPYVRLVAPRFRRLP